MKKEFGVFYDNNRTDRDDRNDRDPAFRAARVSGCRF